MKPHGDCILSMIAMPSDTNVNGDIFGGWLLSQMDLAGAVYCRRLSPKRFVTVAIESMTFLVPVHVGDVIHCHASTIKTGRTSVSVKIEVWAAPFETPGRVKVTEGTFIYVAIDEQGQSTPLQLYSDQGEDT